MSRQAARQSETPPVARRICQAQEEKGWNNAELARQVDVSLRLVLKWRAGDVVPSFPNMKRLEAALGKPVSWFFTEDGDNGTEAAA